jgi:hypothetical protein
VNKSGVMGIYKSRQPSLTGVRAMRTIRGRAAAPDGG